MKKTALLVHALKSVANTQDYIQVNKDLAR